ncbi:MAG TPA: hypothetical protein VGA73_15185 [Candidatus Binatia bacterium]
MDAAVSILLAPECLDSFLTYAPIGSAVFLAIHAAVDITRYIKNSPYRFLITCDERTAGEMQRIAVAHCPAAIGEIEESIRLARDQARRPAPRR